jgi:glycosyltransferase involved in cell wall biosynthesis
MNPTSSPSVAVVLPTHDRPELLRRAIGAIVDQDYPGQIDVIVVFDRAQPDETLVESSDARTVRVTANARTPGLPGGRNTGIALTEGAEFVAFCDDDDMWLPGKLRAQIDHMVAHNDVALCTTGIVIDFEGEENERPSPVEELTVESLVHDRTTEAHPSTFLFRRSALVEVGPVDEEIPGGYSEDYDFLLRIAKIGRISCLREPLASIRWGRTSYFATRWQTIVDAQRYLMAKHPEFAEHRKAEARLRGQVAFALAALGERRAALGEVTQVIRRWPFERRWPVAILVALRIISADRALELAHKFGRGI